MEYRIKSGPWYQFSTFKSPVLNYGGEVIVAIDPGKTNMAMTIGDPYGIPLSYVELTGKGCNTTDYCSDFMDFITKYLSTCTVILFGVEQAVSYKGMQYHVSQMVLTEIRANLLQMIKRQFKLTPVEINNWSWKKAILPDGYRSQKEKGSYRYFTERGLRDVTHDVTDSICMYLYLQQVQLGDYPDPYCNRHEECIATYNAAIVDDSLELSNGYKAFKFNPAFSLTDNLSYYVNRCYGCCYLEVDASCLTLDDIYSLSCAVKAPTEKLKVVVARTSS